MMFERRVSWIFACMVSMIHIVSSAAPIILSHKADAVPVLIYHEIVTDGKAEGETVISLTRFSQQMQHLAEGGYVPISMNELVRFMNGKTSSLPARPVVLTFDDGWKSVLNAVPILERYGFRASFWIITGKGIGGDYLDWSDVEALSRNPRFEVYSHTVSHPWNPADNLLTWVQNKVPGRGMRDAILELRDSKQTLEEHLKRPNPYLAWPCGWYDETLISLARQTGYVALLTAQSGMNHKGDDVLRIKRTFVDGACDIKTFRETLTTGKYHVCQTSSPVTRGHAPDGTSP